MDEYPCLSVLSSNNQNLTRYVKHGSHDAVLSKMLSRKIENVSIPISISLKGRKRGGGWGDSICILYKMSTSLIYDMAINLHTSHPNPFWRKIMASNIIH